MTFMNFFVRNLICFPHIPSYIIFNLVNDEVGTYKVHTYAFISVGTFHHSVQNCFIHIISFCSFAPLSFVDSKLFINIYF